jgi:hypothetical protein
VALTQEQRAEVIARLEAFCADRVPAHARAKVRLAFRINGSDVVLLEKRPRFRTNIWGDTEIAKFKYVAIRREWRLYCKYSDLKWHGYENLPASRTFEALLEEVDRDPTHIFWG